MLKRQDVYYVGLHMDIQLVHREMCVPGGGNTLCEGHERRRS